MKRFKKAKKYSLRALPFIEHLASTNHAVYAEILLFAKKLHQIILEKKINVLQTILFIDRSVK